MNMHSKDFFEQLENIFNSLKLLLKNFSKTQDVTQDSFEQAARASLVKTFEYNCDAITCEAEQVFFMISTLRGICEDYITLKFISDKLYEDKDRIIELKLREELYKSSVAQWQFFKKNHPNQTPFYRDDFETKIKDTKQELRNLLIEKGIACNRSNSFPSVKEMAKQSESLELYEYLYHATSSLVHFNPRVLLRMGWGKIPEVTFSVKNFNDYYKDFACFYGAYLFSVISKWMISIRIIDNTIEDTLHKIDDLLNSQNRWPELVTFEEMNIGGITKLMFFKSPSMQATDSEK